MSEMRNELGTLLIVEDSLTQAEMLKYQFEEEGFQVMTASNGKVALEILTEHIPELIISDVVMPEMNGYEFCKAVKADVTLRQIPIILLTTLREVEDVIMGLECQADYFISKSINHDALFLKVKSILEIDSKIKKEDALYEQTIYCHGVQHVIHSTPSKTLNFILTIYELSFAQNKALLEVQDQLRLEIEERIKLQQELERAKDAAEAGSRAKSAFLANMSHEIRTPMNAILGFSQLLLRSNDLTPIQTERLNTINRSGEHLLNLINDILDISKIEAGRLVINNTTFDLLELINDIESMFRIKTDSKDLRLIVEIDSALEKYVVSDVGKLRQILINLLSNAIKFTKDGGIALRIKTIPSTTDKITLIAEVEDTGPGIEADELGTLFKLFEQTQSGKNAGGTGLGLAISMQFARLLGGDITLQSEVGVGSRFRMEIQLGKGFSKDVKAVYGHKKVIGLNPMSKVGKILVVDDKKENREFLKEVLNSVGFDVLCTNSGEEAVKMVEKLKPQLVMMDLKMPGIDGIEATRQIKALEGGKETHVIMVTATAFDDDLHTLLTSGAELYIRKPFRINEVLETISKCIDVQYIFEEESTEEEQINEEVCVKALQDIPNELSEALEQATVNAELDRMLSLIDEVEAVQPILAKKMRTLANNFQYEALITLLKKRMV